MNITHSQFPHSERLGELTSRPDFAALQWGSTCNSLEILPALNTSWKKLGDALRATGKPIGDLGASCSTVAAEGIMRGIPVIPVDLQVSFPISRYSALVRNAIDEMRPRYCGELPFEPGMEPGSPIPIDRWDLCVSDAIEKARTAYLRADLAAIPVPARTFSVSLVSDTIPKHSPSFETFLSVQLPEILRVTDRTALIFPIAMFREVVQERLPDGSWSQVATVDPTKIISGDQREVILQHTALYAEASACAKIAEVALRCGFQFKLERSKEDLNPAHPEQFLGDVPALGVFERIGES